MRALWSDRPNCSHNVSQKVKRISRVSEKKSSGDGAPKLQTLVVVERVLNFGPFHGEKDFGALSGGPFFFRPLCFTADACLTDVTGAGGQSIKMQEPPFSLSVASRQPVRNWG